MPRAPPPLVVAALVALAVLAALPAAQAQAGVNDPKVSLSVAVTPKSPTIPLGGSASFRVDVTVATTNIFCNNPGSIDVALALKDAGLPGVAGSLPSSLTVPIAANLAPPAVSQGSGGNATARLEVTVASSTAPDHDHGFTVTANTPAALPSGCQAASASPPPAATATADVALRTGPAPMGAVVSSSGSSTCTASSGSSGTSASATANCAPAPAKKSSFVPMPLQVAALLAVGLLGRRHA